MSNPDPHGLTLAQPCINITVISHNREREAEGWQGGRVWEWRNVQKQGLQGCSIVVVNSARPTGKGRRC